MTLRGVDMGQRWSTGVSEEPKIIVVCENCSQKLRIPKRKKKLIVTCPTCRYTFPYRYYGLNFSSSSKKPLLVGLVGSLVGFTLVEIIEGSQVVVTTSVFLSSMLAIGAFGICFGAVMGAAEGFFKKDRARLIYGLMIGAILGLVSGVISGLVAQFVFSTILSSVPYGSYPSFTLLMFARIIGWCVLGLLIGVSYGIKENTLGDVKFGLMGGAIGGAVGGFLFDPLSFVIQIGDGTLGRLIGFATLGMAIGIAVNKFREVAIVRNRPEMYKQLTGRLPSNLRLPPPSSK
jgi:hypothetical protein